MLPRSSNSRPSSFRTIALLAGIATLATGCLAGDASEPSDSLDSGLDPLPSSQKAAVRRIQGSDPFSTAIALAEDLYPTGISDAVIAPADEDGAGLVAGSYIAAFRRVPLLLTAPESLTTQTEAALKAMGVTRVTLVSGSPPLSSQVDARLTALNISSTRVSGIDHFEIMANAVRAVGPRSKRAFLVVAVPLEDASISVGIASQLDAPLLLIGKTSIPPVTSRVMADLEISETILVGQAKDVSAGVKSQLPKPSSIPGPDLLETSLLLSTFGDVIGVDTSSIVVHACSSQTMMTAMISGQARMPQLCAEKDVIRQQALDWLSGASTNVRVVGSSAELSDKVMKQICASMGC